jgi:hypothetical protein
MNEVERIEKKEEEIDDVSCLPLIAIIFTISRRRMRFVTIWK